MTVRAYYYSVPSGGTFTRGEDGFITYETDSVKIRTDKTVQNDIDEYIVIDGKNNNAIVYETAQAAEELIVNLRQSDQYSTITYEEKAGDPTISPVNIKVGALAQWGKGVYNVMPPNTPDQNGQQLEDYNHGQLGDNGKGVIVYVRTNPLAAIPGITGTILGKLSTGARYNYLSSSEIAPQYSNNSPETYVRQHDLSLSSRAEISLSDFLPRTPVDPELFAEYDLGRRWTNSLYSKDGEFTPTHSTDSYFNQSYRAGAEVKVNLNNIFGDDLSAILPTNLGILFFIEGNKPVNK